ncbi:hypothetical protein [Duganella sp. BJB1802]|uniref:hypothetical protein n=1 Tax=Duganella sp. BJB1802 TaxID=2744575 RepID=UPI001C3DB737|nr:hypothetical protein [Duganella sp. BJB1802]
MAFWPLSWVDSLLTWTLLSPTYRVVSRKSSMTALRPPPNTSTRSLCMALAPSAV